MGDTLAASPCLLDMPLAQSDKSHKYGDEVPVRIMKLLCCRMARYIYINLVALRMLMRQYPIYCTVYIVPDTFNSFRNKHIEISIMPAK